MPYIHLQDDHDRESDRQSQGRSHHEQDVLHAVLRLEVRHDMIEILCEDAVQLVRFYPEVVATEIIRVRVALTIIRNRPEHSIHVLEEDALGSYDVGLLVHTEPLAGDDLTAYHLPVALDDEGGERLLRRLIRAVIRLPKNMLSSTSHSFTHRNT